MVDILQCHEDKKQNPQCLSLVVKLLKNSLTIKATF